MKRITDRELEKVIGGITLEVHSNTLPTENLAPPTQSTIEDRNKQMSIRLSNLPKSTIGTKVEERQGYVPLNLK